MQTVVCGFFNQFNADFITVLSAFVDEDYGVTCYLPRTFNHSCSSLRCPVGLHKLILKALKCQWSIFFKPQFFQPQMTSKH